MSETAATAASFEARNNPRRFSTFDSSFSYYAESVLIGADFFQESNPRSTRKTVRPAPLAGSKAVQRKIDSGHRRFIATNAWTALGSRAHRG
jgi:hypothetical protein